MAEQEPLIPRKESPELVLHVGETAIVATYDNARIQLYVRFTEMSHILLSVEGELPYGGRIFDDGMNRRYMVTLGYPMSLDPYPTDEVVLTYEEYLADRLGDDPREIAPS